MIGAAALILFVFTSPQAGAKTKKDNTTELRTAYIQKVQQASKTQPVDKTLGSLWSVSAPLAEVATDYKARGLHDTIIIQVTEQTTATSNANSQQNRTLAVNSAITGLGGHVSTGGVNPILTAGSSQALKGNGQIEADSQFQTSLTGQVVSVLPNGNLVVEAQRAYSLNGQRDTVIVRGVVRPGDIGSANQVLSTQLMNLEVELKGKGLVSDGARGPNVITRTLMRLLGF